MRSKRGACLGAVASLGLPAGFSRLNPRRRGAEAEVPMKRWIGVPLFVSSLCTAAPLCAQTTGRIVGQATDVAGQPTPGTTLTIRSASLQGSRSAATDERGDFHFAFLSPGTYSVTAELAGFKPV